MCTHCLVNSICWCSCICFLYCYVSTLLLLFSFLLFLAALISKAISWARVNGYDMYPKCLNKLEGELEHVLVKVITILVKNL